MHDLDKLRQAVNVLNTEYAHCIDDDELERWPDFFAGDCEYQIIARENVEAGLPAAVMFCDSRGMLVDRIAALRKANIYPAHTSRHLVGNCRITGTDGEVIRAESSYVVFQTRSDGETRVFNAGKYVDEIIQTGAGLKYRKRTCIYDTHRIQTLLVTPI
ncbi:MAG: aromatic-ring-hydroxylating dioxygenase subunit beta [Alphaproteobacteria bacterium]